MTSLKIAELTGKPHFHVMRDIVNLISSLEARSNLNWYCELSTYVDEQGKSHEIYHLDKKTTLYLIYGYDPISRMHIIDHIYQFTKHNINLKINHNASQDEDDYARWALKMEFAYQAHIVAAEVSGNVTLVELDTPSSKCSVNH